MTVTGYTIDGVEGTQTVATPVSITGVGTITINANGKRFVLLEAQKKLAIAIPCLQYGWSCC